MSNDWHVLNSAKLTLQGDSPSALLIQSLNTCIYIYFIFLTIFNWSIVNLHCYVRYRYTNRFSYTYIHIFFFRFFSIIGYHKTLNINRRFLLLICFMHSSVCMLIPVSSSFAPPSLSSSIFRFHKICSCRSRFTHSCFPTTFKIFFRYLEGIIRF